MGPQRMAPHFGFVSLIADANNVITTSAHISRVAFSLPFHRTVPKLICAIVKTVHSSYEESDRIQDDLCQHKLCAILHHHSYNNSDPH